jgi:hypothetical protein
MRNAYKSLFFPKALKEYIMRGWANGFKGDVKSSPRECGLDSYGSGYRPVAGSCENSNRPKRSVLIKEAIF